ncbi:MAG: 4Fe-4S dicluster domain-containing protein, partial [Epsilonproteobacteria bacterium]|nr:4Fe-4S dicluster domain-containing protein [Campylobacterota bacterium]
VVCPVEANIFGDIDDETSHISRYIMKHQGKVQVRKPEKHTDPKHFYVGGGNQTLNPLAHQRLEEYGLFNKVTHLEHVGDPHHSILDRFLAPIFGHEAIDNTGFADMQSNKGGK